MDLTIYDIIRGPIVTDKAYKLNKQKQLVVEVHIDANKKRIKEALEQLFDVKVAEVRTSIRKGKKRLIGKRYPTVGKKIKKAIISLKEGYSIDMLNQQAGEMPSVESTNNQQQG